MSRKYTCLCLVLLVTVAKPLDLSDAVDPLGCGSIIKSCQSRCQAYPGRFVRWSVNLAKLSMFCVLHNGTVNIPLKSGSNPVISKFDVECCPGKSVLRQANLPGARDPFMNELYDKKLDTLFVLGVTTLGSIVLMCVFVLMGLIIYKKSNRSYGMKSSKRDENQQLVKESEKTTSTIMTVSDFGQDNKCEYSIPASCLHTPPPKYHSKTTSSDSDRSTKVEEEAKYINSPNSDSHGPKVVKNYPVQGALYASPQAEVGTKVQTCFPAKDNEPSSSCEVHGLQKAPVDYIVRGGFITPIKAETEPKTTRFVTVGESGSSEPYSDSVVIHSNTTYQSQPAVKSKSNDAVEDPYVQAPPLKSARQKVEKPEQYQRLVPNNSDQKQESGDYNMLLHNPVPSSTDMKTFMIINNNTASVQRSNQDNKCEVVLKNSCET